MPSPAPPEDGAPPADARLDCRGLYCPLPVLRTERALAGMAPGEVLSVVATDPAASLDFKVFCQREGHELVREERRGGELRFWLRRAGDPR